MNHIAKTSALVVAAMLLLAACQTTAGAGQDLSKGGNDITNAAHRNE